MAHHLEMKLSNFVGWRAEKSLKMMVFEGLRAGAVRVFSRGSPGTESIAITGERSRKPPLVETPPLLTESEIWLRSRIWGILVVFGLLAACGGQKISLFWLFPEGQMPLICQNFRACGGQLLFSNGILAKSRRRRTKKSVFSGFLKGILG